MFMYTMHLWIVCVYHLLNHTLSQATIGDILHRKDALRKMEDLGAQVEEALIFDNKLDSTHPSRH